MNNSALRRCPIHGFAQIQLGLAQTRKWKMVLILSYFVVVYPHAPTPRLVMAHRGLRIDGEVGAVTGYSPRG